MLNIFSLLKHGKDRRRNRIRKLDKAVNKTLAKGYTKLLVNCHECTIKDIEKYCNYYGYKVEKFYSSGKNKDEYVDVLITLDEGDEEYGQNDIYL